MARVWLTKWEWECCGDAFTVGDAVDFGISTRAPHADLADRLGAALGATVDAIESHHEDEFADRVRGRVVAVYAVTHEVIERPSLRRPRHGAPPTALMPPDGEDWPMTGRDLGNGVFLGFRPSRHVIETVPVPESAALVPTHGVRSPVSEGEEPRPAASGCSSEAPPERRVRSMIGWLVDIDED